MLNYKTNSENNVITTKLTTVHRSARHPPQFKKEQKKRKKTKCELYYCLSCFHYPPGTTIAPMRL